MRFLLSLVAVVGAARAMLVTEGSPCSTSCGNVLTSTEEEDIVCDQALYDDTDGELFKNCVECELTSEFAAGGESDAQWMLYNLRYAASYCVFGFPGNKDVENTPCRTSEACGPFQDAIRHENLTTDELDKYDYCASWPVTDVEHVENCRICLEVDGQEYMANFITTLQAGCEQQPEDGATVALDGTVFSTETVTIANPLDNAKIDPAWFDNGPLDIGAKAGIAAGGVVLILSIAGCCIIWRGKRKRRAFLRNYEAKQGRSKGWPSPIQTKGMKEVSDTPVSQRPLRTWDDSPMSQQSEQAFPGRYFSPYSSQYNSPVSASDAVLYNQQWPAAAQPQQFQQFQQFQQQQQQQQQQNIGLALGNVDPDAKGKDKASESYEMQFVDNGYHDERMPTPGDEDYFTHRQRGRTYSGSYRNFSGVSRDPIGM